MKTLRKRHKHKSVTPTEKERTQTRKRDERTKPTDAKKATIQKTNRTQTETEHAPNLYNLPNVAEKLNERREEDFEDKGPERRNQTR